jgi:hypothetical protein
MPEQKPRSEDRSPVDRLTARDMSMLRPDDFGWPQDLRHRWLR